MKIFIKYLLFFILLAPIFIFRDFTPDNELRYLSIADEAICNGDIFTFTNHGLDYADKPPLYLWFVMIGKLLFGTHSLFFLGLFSAIPALILLYIMDRWTAPYLSDKWRLAAQLMLLSTVYFVGPLVVLRMDMLMCMFIVLSLYTFFKLYTRTGRPIDKTLFPLYLFMALFTKGPVGILVPLLSIIVFLILKKEIKTIGQYWGMRTLSILLGLCAVWFAGVYIEGGYTYLHNLLFNQTVNRAVDSFHHQRPFYYYFVSMWYAMSPWIFLYVVTIILAIRRKLITTDLEKFFLTIAGTTFIMLSCISSKIDIYLLPAYPFITYFSVLILNKLKTSKWVTAAIAIPAILLIAVLPGIFVFKELLPFPLLKMPLVIAGAAILSGSAVFSAISLFKGKNIQAIYNLSGGLLLTIFVCAFSIPQLNHMIGWKGLCEKAKEIAGQKQISQFCSYKISRAENMDVYLNQEIEVIENDSLNVWNKKECIILVPTNKIENDTDLKHLISDNDVISEGNYSIVVLKSKTRQE